MLPQAYLLVFIGSALMFRGVSKIIDEGLYDAWKNGNSVGYRQGRIDSSIAEYEQKKHVEEVTAKLTDAIAQLFQDAEIYVDGELVASPKEKRDQKVQEKKDEKKEKEKGCKCETREVIQDGVKCWLTANIYCPVHHGKNKSKEEVIEEILNMEQKSEKKYRE